MSIAKKIGCSAQTLPERVNKAEVDVGKQTAVSTETAEKLTRRAA